MCIKTFSFLPFAQKLATMSFSKNERWIQNAQTKLITTHASAHIVIINNDDNNIEKNIIFGQNKKYKNLAHFGGLPNPSETVIETAVREFQEESLNSIMDSETLRSKLENPIASKISFAQSVRRDLYVDHYCFFLETKFDFDGAADQFIVNRQNLELTIDQQENEKLISVPLSNLKQSINHLLIADPDQITFDSVQNIYVNDVKNNSYLLRSYSIFPLIFWLKSGNQ